MGVEAAVLADGWTRATRMSRYRAVSSRLASAGEKAAAEMLEQAVPAGVRIGGQTAVLTVEGVPVFVKKVPLTDLERRAEHIRSTANLFDLPTFYQYGIGSAGFGAWRELAAHPWTTDWVLRGGYPGFPLLYHWRVMPQEPAGIQPTELERWVAHWDDSPAVRARLAAIGGFSAAVVLFMECLPYTVDTWLTEQAAAGSDAAARAFAVVERDFGLAASSRFDLSPTERAFLRRHATYDRCYTATHLTQWLVSNLLQIPWADCHLHIRDGLSGRRYADLPPSAARIVARHAPVTAVMCEFFNRLLTVSKSTPYPAESLHLALQG